MKKPLSLKFVNIIIYIKLSFLILFILLLLLFIFIPTNNDGIFYNVKIGALESFIADPITDYSDDQLVAILSEKIGEILLPVILLLLNIIFIMKFRYKSTVVMMILQTLFALSGSFFGILLSVVLLFIILFNKNTRNYLKKSQAIESTVTSP
jgi:hypothetical protein